jgi:hypothetical protein
MAWFGRVIANGAGRPERGACALDKGNLSAFVAPFGLASARSSHRSLILMILGGLLLCASLIWIRHAPEAPEVRSAPPT